MELVGNPLRRHMARFHVPFTGVALSTAAILLQTPVLTISQLKCPDKFVFFILVLLIPLNFYLNLLLLLLHVMAHAGAPEAPSPVFLMRQLPRAAGTVSLATLLIITPLSVHAAVAEQSIGLEIGAAFVCLALVTMLSSAFNKLLISGGFAPPLLALCISTGFLIAFHPILLFTHKNHYDILITNHIPIQFLLMFVSFSVFMLAITLLLLRIGPPADGQPAALQAEKLVIAALSVAIATLLLGGYMEVYMAHTEKWKQVEI